MRDKRNYLAYAFRKGLIKSAQESRLSGRLTNLKDPFTAGVVGGVGGGTIGAVISALAGSGPKGVILSTLLTAALGASLGAGGAYLYGKWSSPE